MQTFIFSCITHALYIRIVHNFYNYLLTLSTPGTHDDLDRTLKVVTEPFVSRSWWRGLGTVGCLSNSERWFQSFTI